MSKSKKNNNSVDEITTKEVVDVEDTVESTEIATEETTVATEETLATTTEETVTESTTEKEDTSSKETVPTETVMETPAAEKTTETSVETKTEQPVTETVEEKKEEITTKEPVPEITLATVLRVRFCSLFSNKRLATRRNMPLYNIIYTHIHNRASYIGLCNGERYDDVIKYIQNNTITIESTKLSDKLKEQIIRKLKQDTDYAKIKWGNIDKQ